jgi:hypothetical protein
MIREVNLGSRIWILSQPGSKANRHRITDPDPQHWAGTALQKTSKLNEIFICCKGVNGGRDATATLFLLLDLATFFDLFHGGKHDEALDTLGKIKIIPLNQQDVDYLVAGILREFASSTSSIGRPMLCKKIPRCFQG